MALEQIAALRGHSGLGHRHGSAGGAVSTSQQRAGSVNTNPVVIRRLLGQLQKAGLVESHRGAHAGWTLTHELESTTLRDVYDAVEPGPPFGMHRATPDQNCPIGFGIQPAMHTVYDGIERTIGEQLAKSTLADVLRDVLASR
ncbi:MAG: ywnA [Streptosporangiaceae bacterium]|nr:ywnA [Streptosporangiaceae bacterium]